MENENVHFQAVKRKVIFNHETNTFIKEICLVYLQTYPAMPCNNFLDFEVNIYIACYFSFRSNG